MTAIADRPFIIDTLTELLRRHDLKRYVHLHTILREDDGRLISLVYLEIEPILKQQRLQSLLDKIEATFIELTLVTEDFPAMLVHAEAGAQLTSNGAGFPNSTESEREEIAHFLRWLADGGFVFLGYREWEVDPGDKTATVKDLAKESLGLFRSPIAFTKEQLEETERDAQFIANNRLPYHHSKVLMKSPVHRMARMDLFAVQIPLADGGKSKIICFIGLLTSKSLSQESSTIPIIRQKLKQVLELEGLQLNTHNHKEMP